MVRVRVEVRVTTKIPVSVRVRDQKQISRDCALASELVQAVSERPSPLKLHYANKFHEPPGVEPIYNVKL